MKRYFSLTLLAAFTGLTLLSGCATPYSCPLTNEDGYCTNQRQAYLAAKANSGDKENVFAGTGDPAAGAEQHPAAATGDDDIMAMVEHAAAPKLPVTALAYFKTHHAIEDRPVYAPPRPARVWVAPWTDEYGLLHGEELIYALRPGGWAYGELRTPGAASGLLEPLDPDDIGFKLAPKKDEQPSGRVQPRQPLFSTTPLQAPTTAQPTGTASEGPWVKNEVGYSPSRR